MNIREELIHELDRTPDPLLQEVLHFLRFLRTKGSTTPAPTESTPPTEDAWDILESMGGTVDAPEDWSAEHDHYLYGTPKHGVGDG